MTSSTMIGPGRGASLKPRGRVHDVAGDDRLSTLGPGTEGDDRLARGDGGPYGELEPLLPQLLDRVEDAECGSNRALRVVLVRDGRAEHGHDRVADELLDGPSEALDVCLDALVVRAERGAHVLGVRPVGAVGEADEVDEEDGDDLALLPTRRFLCKRVPAREAEAGALGIFLSAGRADHVRRIFAASGRGVYAAGGSSGGSSSSRLLVLRQPALEDAPREDADEAPFAVDDWHALGVRLLEEAERILERDVGPDRVLGRLGDVPERRRGWVATGRHDLAHERLPRDHPDEPLAARHVDGAHLGPVEKLARRLRRVGSGQVSRRGDHPFADDAHGPCP